MKELRLKDSLRILSSLLYYLVVSLNTDYRLLPASPRFCKYIYIRGYSIVNVPHGGHIREYMGNNVCSNWWCENCRNHAVDFIEVPFLPTAFFEYWLARAHARTHTHTYTRRRALPLGENFETLFRFILTVHIFKLNFIFHSRFSTFCKFPCSG